MDKEIIWKLQEITREMSCQNKETDKMVYCQYLDSECQHQTRRANRELKRKFFWEKMFFKEIFRETPFSEA